MTEKKCNKEIIIENSIKLFYEHGYEKTTMRKIAEASGITHPAIFNHFKNKAEIAGILMQRYILGIVKITENYMSENNISDKENNKAFMFYWTAHYYYLKKEFPYFKFTFEYFNNPSNASEYKNDYFEQIFIKIMKWNYNSDIEHQLYSKLIFGITSCLSDACFNDDISVQRAVSETFVFIYAVFKVKNIVSDHEIERFVKDLDYKKYLKYNLLEDILLTDFGKAYTDHIAE